MNERKLGLSHFLIPKMIGGIWWLTVTIVLFLVLGFVWIGLSPWLIGPSMEGMTENEFLKWMLILSLALFFVRVFLECISMIFSIHDRLEEILDELREVKATSGS